MLKDLGVEPCERTYALYLAILQDGVATRSQQRDREEVSALVRLLRETLEAGTRPDAAARSWLAGLRLDEAGQTA